MLPSFKVTKDIFLHSFSLLKFVHIIIPLEFLFKFILFYSSKLNKQKSPYSYKLKSIMTTLITFMLFHAKFTTDVNAIVSVLYMVLLVIFEKHGIYQNDCVFVHKIIICILFSKQSSGMWIRKVKTPRGARICR